MMRVIAGELLRAATLRGLAQRTLGALGGSHRRATRRFRGGLVIVIEETHGGNFGLALELAPRLIHHSPGNVLRSQTLTCARG